MGAGSRVMAADEKAGCADERDDGGGNVHLSDALVTGLSGDGGRGGGREGESGEQAHLYVWLPVCGTLRQPRFD